ncbi:MAG: recombinase family protein [Candidatus Lambdaproteobacteria bacterium]|nr:recombinase family protein [Candidatus Lambdaproteobacteria bacterium]
MSESRQRLRAIGYASLSAISVQPRNLGLDVQERLIRAEAARRGWALVDVVREVTQSSLGRSRPRLADVVARIGAGECEALLVARLDRLTRNVRELDDLLEQLQVRGRVRLVSIEEGLDSATESGRLAVHTVQIVARWEVKRIPDRTREIIARKRARGERVGHAPYGYVYRDRRLVPEEQETRVIALMCRLHDEGQSYRRIARHLNAERIAAKRGGIWYAETVKTVIQSARAAGTAAAAAAPVARRG